MSRLEERVGKTVKARQRISAVLVKELDVEPEIADAAAESCVSLAYSGDLRPPKKRIDYGKALRRAKVPALWLALCLVLLASGKWVFYDHAHWFYVYPRVYARHEGWRPTDKLAPGQDPDDGWQPSWDELTNGDDGQCVMPDQKTCVRGYYLPGLREALNRAVSDNAEGVIWRGANGNGELWMIERKDSRFVIRAEKDDGYRP